jgi:hypothetical protein
MRGLMLFLVLEMSAQSATPTNMKISFLGMFFDQIQF